MRRALIMPVSAAVVGALLAVGVTALDRPHRHEATFTVQSDIAEVREVQRRVEREVRREVERAVRREAGSNVAVTLLKDVKSNVVASLREAAEAEDLSAEERAKILRAIERLEVELPDEIELAPADVIEGITRDDGSAHKDPVAPAVPDVPSPPAGSSGN